MLMAIYNTINVARSLDPWFGKSWGHNGLTSNGDVSKCMWMKCFECDVKQSINKDTIASEYDRSLVRLICSFLCLQLKSPVYC